MIDQSVEGYNAEWLWEWFHNKCDQHNISPSMIIYATGDQRCEEDYNKWLSKTDYKEKLKVVSSTSLSVYVHKHFMQYIKEINLNDLIQYKKHNLDKIYLYDCINLQIGRAHV